MVSLSPQIAARHLHTSQNTSTSQRTTKLSLKFAAAIGILGVASVVIGVTLWLLSGQRYPQLLAMAGAVSIISLGAGVCLALGRSHRMQVGVTVMLLLILLGACLLPVITPLLLPIGVALIVIISIAGWAFLGSWQRLVFAGICILALWIDGLFAQSLSSSLFGEALNQALAQSNMIVVVYLFVTAGLIPVGRQIVLGYETTLAEERAVLRMLIDNLPDNVFVKDRNSRIVIDNAAHARLLGNSTPEEVVGKSDFDFFPPELAQKYYDDEQEMILSGESKFNFEEPTIDPQGKEHWLSTTKVLARDSRGNVVAVVGINHDITALKEAEHARDELLNVEREQRSSLERLVGQIQTAAAQLNMAAAEILAAASQQSGSMVEQEAAIMQTMSTVEEMHATVAQTAERAQNVSDAARQSVNVSRMGQQSIMDTIEGMENLKKKVEDIAENIRVLSARVQQIDEIIGTVNGIAEQSKLLALNASIEAARAGEEGRGFAVVAMEVRHLADESREATARIRAILTEIREATNSAVLVTEEGSKDAERAVNLVEQAGSAIRDLAATIEGAAQSAIQIASSTHQQATGMDQLSLAMSDIRTAASQTVSSTHQMESSVQHLTAMAGQLEQSAEQYRMSGNASA